MEAWIVIHELGNKFNVIASVKPLCTEMYVKFYWSNASSSFVWHTNLAPKAPAFKTYAFKSVWVYKKYLEDGRRHYAEHRDYDRLEKIAIKISALATFVTTLSRQ